MFKTIKGVNENVKELVRSCESDDIVVDIELIKHWISEIVDQIDVNDLITVTRHLLEVEHTRENLLEVYSFTSEAFDRKVGIK